MTVPRYQPPRNTRPVYQNTPPDRSRWRRELAWLIVLVIIVAVWAGVEWMINSKDDKSAATKAKTQTTAQTTTQKKSSTAVTEKDEASVPHGYSSVKGHITHVADGDTVEIDLDGGKQARIRFLGIDAPELHQEGGQDSRKQLIALLKPCRYDVTVIYKDERMEDRYGRLIGKVVCKDTDVNYEMVKAGQAWYYSQYEKDVMTKDRTAYKEAMEAAKKAKLGLWQQPNPKEPWDWRQENREKEQQ